MKTSKILLGLLGMAAVGGGLYWISKNKNAAAALMPGGSASLTQSSTPNLDYVRSHRWIVNAPGAAGFDGTPFPSDYFSMEKDGILYKPDGTQGVLESEKSVAIYDVSSGQPSFAYRALLAS
jgi:hypothetical protein